MLLMIGVGAVGLVLRTLGTRYKKATVSGIGLFLYKQGFITMVMFNCYNISFSAAVQWKYVSASATPLYIFSTIVLYICFGLMVAGILSIQCLSRNGYG